MAINWDTIKGQWKQLSGEARKQWGQLTDSDWERFGGEKDKLLGGLQERYGWTREQAEREVDDFFNRRRM